jgi:hypothetical protein
VARLGWAGRTSSRPARFPGRGVNKLAATLCGELAVTDEMWYQAAFEGDMARLGARDAATGSLPPQ